MSKSRHFLYNVAGSCSVSPIIMCKTHRLFGSHCCQVITVKSLLSRTSAAPQRLCTMVSDVQLCLGNMAHVLKQEVVLIQNALPNRDERERSQRVPCWRQFPAHTVPFCLLIAFCSCPGRSFWLRCR